MTEALLSAMKAEYAKLEEFAALLATEEKALASASPGETLPGIIEQKTQMAEQILTLMSARDKELQALGLPPGFEGLQKAAALDVLLADHWKRLQAMVDRARRANTTNGVMIRMRMNYNDSALAILRGSNKKPAVYGPDGRMSKF